jgi:hypothetical protein
MPESHEKPASLLLPPKLIASEASLISPLTLTSPKSPIDRGSSPVDPEFLSKALSILEDQRRDSATLRQHDRSVLSSPAESMTATPAFSPSSSSTTSDRQDYFFSVTMTPLSGHSSRPSLGERRASSSSLRLGGWVSPPVSIALPPRPQFNENGEELELEQRKEEDDTVVKSFNFNMEPLKNEVVEKAELSIEEAQQLQVARSIKMRRKSNRALDVQLGFEMNGARIGRLQLLLLILSLVLAQAKRAFRRIIYVCSVFQSFSMFSCGLPASSSALSTRHSTFVPSISACSSYHHPKDSPSFNLTRGPWQVRAGQKQEQPSSSIHSSHSFLLIQTAL